MTVVLPRLPREVAERLIADARAVAVTTLPPFPRDVTTTWPAVGDTRITSDTLRNLRQEVVELAQSHGYPSETQRLQGFDATCAGILRRNLDLTPYEASQDDAWTYLTCVWLLDIAIWRFGQDADVRRFVGNVNRNTFRRLWWRVEILGPHVDLAKFGEDELVSILERPSLAANKALAQKIAVEFLRVVDDRSDLPRMRLMREANKRLLRRSAFIDDLALGEEELYRYVRSAFESTVAALSGLPLPIEEWPPVRRPPSDNVVQSTGVTITDAPNGFMEGRNRAAAPPRVLNVFERRLGSDTVGQIALDMAARLGHVTAQMMKEQLSISTVEARRILHREVAKGALVQNGRARGTYYTLPPDADIQVVEERAAESLPSEPSGPDATARSRRTLLSRLLQGSEADGSDVNAHIESAFAGAGSGFFLTIAEIARHRPHQSQRPPSRRLIQSALFPADGGPSKVPGVVPGVDEHGRRGAAKA